MSTSLHQNFYYVFELFKRQYFKQKILPKLNLHPHIVSQKCLIGTILVYPIYVFHSLKKCSTIVLNQEVEMGLEL